MFVSSLYENITETYDGSHDIKNVPNVKFSIYKLLLVLSQLGTTILTEIMAVIERFEIKSFTT